MNLYYSLVASLPLLTNRTDPPVDEDYFMASCYAQLSPEGCSILEQCSLAPSDEAGCVHPVLAEWWEWETSLRNELTFVRSEKMGLEPERWLRGDGEIGAFRELVGHAVQAKTPLEAEEMLNDARWEFLDSLEVGHHFDLEFLILYRLKLQIASRRRLFTPEGGAEEYRSIYSGVVEQVRDIGGWK